MKKVSQINIKKSVAVRQLILRYYLYSKKTRYESAAIAPALGDSS